MKDYEKKQLAQPLIGKNFVGDQFFADGKAYIVSLQCAVMAEHSAADGF